MKEHMYFEKDGVDIGCIYDHDISKLTLVLPTSEVIVEDVEYGVIEHIVNDLHLKELYK